MDIMKSIEIDHSEDILCPYCKVILVNQEEEVDFQLCEHTIFVASDYGFEYVREDYEHICSLDLDASNIDSFTKNLPVNGIRLVQYSSPPGLLGAYWGFVEKGIK
jgi:hypothetical protein